VAKDTCLANALRAQRTRPATSAVSQDTLAVTAPTQLLRVPDVAVVVVEATVVDLPRSATSVAK